MAKVLAICNRKGGCGKTTTAVNLAAEWGVRGLNTLLIDLDCQGHAGLGFDIVAKAGKPAAHRIFDDPDFTLASAIRHTKVPNVAVVPADRTFDGAWAARDVKALDRQLRAPEIADVYDVILLDTPPSLDPILINALAAADDALVPVMPHALSTEGVRQFTRLFYRIATQVKPGLRFAGVVPIMLNERINHQRQVLRDLADEFGERHVFDGIRTDIQLAEAFKARQPISVFSSKSRGAEDYRQLATRLIENLDLGALLH